jgi:hypothetical protein
MQLVTQSCMQLGELISTVFPSHLHKFSHRHLINYTQKVPYRPPIGAPDPDATQRIGHIVGRLKDVALATGAPIVAVAASDEAGPRSGKVRLADLLGPSQVQYKCDVGIIQNPHDVGDNGRQTVLWTIEKNRSGPTDMAIIFHGW